MHQFRRFTKPIAYTLCAGILIVGTYVPAQAAIVATDAAVGGQQAQVDRTYVRSLVERESVKQQLVTNGVDPQRVLDRIAALSDQEVHALAQEMDQMPAGGSAAGAIVFVFLVLLITDLLGYTDVFPFVKKTIR